MPPAVNFSGSIIVGFAQPGTSDTTGVVWQGGQVSRLLPTAGWTRAIARGVSDDGAVIVGMFYPGIPQVTAVWTRGGVPDLLADYLAGHGVTVPQGWTLWDCPAASADGLTFGGWARSDAGVNQGFVAHIAAPSSLGSPGAGLLSLGWFAPRRRS